MRYGGTEEERQNVLSRLTDEYVSEFMRTPREELVRPTATRARLIDRCEVLCQLHEELAHEWNRRAERMRSWHE